MQICATCGAKNIDDLRVCWQCRNPLVPGVPPPPGAPSRYRARPRGVRPAVGLVMLVLFAAGIAAWWFLRAPEPIQLPPAFAGVPRVPFEPARDEAVQSVAERMEIRIGTAVYGDESESSARYALFVFRDLHPPYTAAYVLDDFRRYITAIVPHRGGQLVIERRIRGVLYGCHRATPDRMLGAAGLGPERLHWCSWQVDDEAGIFMDLVSADAGTALRHAQDARASVA